VQLERDAWEALGAREKGTYALRRAAAVMIEDDLITVKLSPLEAAMHLLPVVQPLMVVLATTTAGFISR